MQNKLNMYVLEKEIGNAKVLYNKIFYNLSHASKICSTLNDEKRGNKFYIKEVVYLNDTQPE